MNSSVQTRRLPLRKKLLFGAVTLLAVFVGLETVIRVGAYFIYGRSPYFLYYGFREASADDNPEGHNVPYRGYSKFQPNRLLHQYGMFKDPTPIAINSHGLRGPEFSAAKPADMFRVICVGESSTFGFFDRDAHTYPAQLDAVLKAEGPWHDKRPEVINAGIPHANSDNILAMIKGELLDYNPDVITLYAGFNDAVLSMDETALQATLRWLHAHFTTYVALKRAITALGGPALHSHWAGYLSNVSPASVTHQVDLHVARYEHNVREMVQLATSRHIQFVFIRQPVVFDFDNAASDWRTKPFAARLAQARAKAASGQSVTGTEASLIVQGALLDVLDKLSAELKVPVVDNVAIMDQHPEYFASYVHITEAGNHELAGAIRHTLGASK